MTVESTPNQQTWTLAPLIELQGASVTLDGHDILREIDFQLLEGQHWAILGGNGAGKSTFLRLLAGQIWPHPHTSRSYCVDGARTWSPLRAREHLVLLSPEVQDRYVRQLMDGPDHEKGWRLTVWEAVCAGFFGSELLHQQPCAAQIARATEVLEQLKLAPLQERELNTLSQGQMRRVLLARALVNRPRLLLLDEACSGLDAASRREMLALIEEIARSGETQVLMTTHRQSEVVPAITHVLRLNHGRVHSVTQRGSASEIPPAGTARTLAALPAERALRPEACAEVPLLKLERVDVYLDGTPVLQDLNWQLFAGEHWAISGENGAGKSTFLRLLRGELAPALGGSLQRFGDARRRPVWEVGEGVALLSPALQARFRDLVSVEAAVGSGFKGVLGDAGKLTAPQMERVQELMEVCKLQHLAGRTFGKLSYGQTRRVLLARALVHRPRILLLDEALDGLDAGSREELALVLETYANQGNSVVVVSHHEEDWPSFLTHVLSLQKGRIAGEEKLL